MDTLYTQADLNKRLVEAVVKLRVRDCKRCLLIAADQMEKAQQAITRHLLSGLFVDSTIDPLSDLSLAMIEGEVELEVAEPSAVIALACLHSFGEFDPEMYIAMKYMNPVTRQYCDSVRHIRSLVKSFPFTPVFQPLGPSQFYVVSDAGRLILSIYAKSRGAPEVQYAVAAADTQGRPRETVSPLTLPAGWGLTDG